MADDKMFEGWDEIATSDQASDFWQKQYEDAQSGGRNFLFFKKERTRIRIMAHTKNFTQWTRKVQSFFRGNWSTKYLIPCYEITDPKSQTEFLFQIAVVTKGTYSALTQMIREGYKFFEPNGKAITVMRHSGPPVSYTLIPSPDPVLPNREMWEAAQNMEWDYYVAEHDKMQEGKQTDNVSGDTNSLADAIVNANPSPSDEEPW